VDSYLPYEGKVVLSNKKARRVGVRIPSWVNRREVVCGVGNRRTTPIWAGPWLLFEGLKGGEKLVVRFPMREWTERFVLDGQEYRAEFKGNTVIAISPRQGGVGYPIYERGHYRRDVAPLRRGRRYVPKAILRWV
jgi:hypothetical protein